MSFYPIGVVERDTGIGRDTLRIWERRYGFPEPDRNNKGERIYPEFQLRRLQRIRRLLDQGYRPGKIVTLSEAALDAIEAGLHVSLHQRLDKTTADIIDASRSADVSKVQQLLRTQYRRQGMRDFILLTCIPLLKTVGELWASGDLKIFQEHFLSQQLIGVLNIEIAQLQEHARGPRILLATLPGEDHSLGLLMVAGMLSVHGVSIINLGANVPMDQIENAVQQFNADVVGVTFSAAYAYNLIRPHISELRTLINDDVDIWVGGEGVRRMRKLPAGVTKFTTLEKLPE